MFEFKTLHMEDFYSSSLFEGIYLTIEALKVTICFLLFDQFTGGHKGQHGRRYPGSSWYQRGARPDRVWSNLPKFWAEWKQIEIQENWVKHDSAGEFLFLTNTNIHASHWW